MINKKSKIFFFIFLIIVLYLSFLVIRPYLSVAIIALIVASIFHPLKKKFDQKFKKPLLSRILTVIIISVIILLPFVVFADIIIHQAISFNRDLSGLFNDDNANLDLVLNKTNLALSRIPGVNYTISRENADQFLADVIRPVANFFLSKLTAIGTSSLSILTKIIVFIILLFGFLDSHDKLLQYIKKLSPLDDRLDTLYLKRIFAMTRAMFKGIFIIALLQGIAAGLLFLIAGIPYIPFFTLIMIFFSIIPIGAGLISIPAGIILILLGKIWQGILVIAGTILIVSNLDNILRPRLTSRDAELNPALVLLGVLGGIKLFGFWGVIYGPVILIILTTTLESYLHNPAKLKTK